MKYDANAQRFSFAAPQPRKISITTQKLIDTLFLLQRSSSSPSLLHHHHHHDHDDHTSTNTQFDIELNMSINLCEDAHRVRLFDKNHFGRPRHCVKHDVKLREREIYTMVHELDQGNEEV